MSLPYVYALHEDAGHNQKTRELPAGVRAFYVLLALVFGLFYGTLGSVQHQVTFGYADSDWPIGVVVALIGFASLAAVFRSFGAGIGRVLQFSAGTLCAVAILSMQSAGGTVLIPDNTAGWSWLFGVVAISAVAVLWPLSRRHTS